MSKNKALSDKNLQNKPFNDRYKGLPDGAFTVLTVNTTGKDLARQFTPDYVQRASVIEVTIADFDKDGKLTNIWSRVANPKTPYGEGKNGRGRARNAMDYNGITTNMIVDATDEAKTEDGTGDHQLLQKKP